MLLVIFHLPVILVRWPSTVSVVFNTHCHTDTFISAEQLNKTNIHLYFRTEVI